MSIKVNFGEKPLVENEERTGWMADESGLQTVVFKEAYITQSQHGAYALNLVTLDAKKEKRTHQMYFTNRAGDVFYVDKKSKENKMMPNYQLINSMCAVLGISAFSDQLQNKTKQKTLMLRDWESRKDIATQVTSFPQMVNKRITLGIMKGVKNKFSGGKTTNEKQEYNEIDKVFDFSTGASAKELVAVKKDPTAKLKDKDLWVKYWDGRVKDEFKPLETADEEEELGGDEVLSFGDEPEEEEEILEEEDVSFGEDDDDLEKDFESEEPSLEEEEDDGFDFGEDDEDDTK